MNVLIKLQENQSKELIDQFIQNFPPKYTHKLPNISFFTTQIQTLIQQQQKLPEQSLNLQFIKARGFSYRKFKAFNQFRQLVTSIIRLKEFDITKFITEYTEQFKTDQQYVQPTHQFYIKLIFEMVNIYAKAQRVQSLINDIFDESLLWVQSNQQITHNSFMMLKVSEIQQQFDFQLQSTLLQILQIITGLQLNFVENQNYFYQLYNTMQIQNSIYFQEIAEEKKKIEPKKKSFAEIMGQPKGFGSGSAKKGQWW
ncbi:Hypothetical_protein [Hexamita inflata]|uniref:Hypothetical_protein n=1 Tax=Hexamita inflata TaxID=28002 RepID=A0AA86UDC2_9EUKA|nr:Hypothetical protein HINF_LOCUS34337 [Hexamita inflata]CAI9971320.1 Hypothetical protein HINF_LOCUS58965 [Hexamita inflata]